MNLSELRALLEQHGLQLTKSLGQNFLHDGNQLRRIVALAEVHPGDKILEVGPGLGALTSHLLAAGCEVLAIEKDTRLAAVLRERCQGKPLTIELGDAVRVLRERPPDWAGWKLVANLPYSVASPILVDLALAPTPPERMVVTVQLEVARRLAASPDTADYGLLSLLVQARFRPGEWFRIPEQSFYPPPRVVSACLRLDRRSKPVVAEAVLPVYRKLVKCAFSQRRKKMIKLLRNLWPLPVLEAFYAREALREDIRAEKVTLDQFARLAEHLAATERETDA
ncbi:MAG: ribosomal RNA small subunit methyltransferase A [Verrucomicrobiales bacterium]|nr:ribosomal RNA small subunit methyltransferase A [Verrucomicrobiales bacterium]